MEDEIRKLREALAEKDRQLEEEQRRRENLESITEHLSLQGYLDAHHSLNLAINVILDSRMTTKGNTTNPVGRVYPRRIVPWDDFPTQQEKIWAVLAGEPFPAARFPSQHQLDYVRSKLRPITSEQGLRHFELETVENAVLTLVGVVHDNPKLRDRLGLSGVVTFESHTNLGSSSENVSPWRANNAGEAASTPARPRQIRRFKTGMGTGTADQFCILRDPNDDATPVLAIEYKAPHKLTPEEVSTGLQGEIQPARDIINQHGEGFVFAAKSLMAAVVTQLFSYMVGKGIRYGYVCTGQAFVFLHIPDDPTTVLYYVCMPNADVLDGDDSRLHRTAVSQVFAFLLQSVGVSAPTLTWQDAIAGLDTWVVEYDDVLRHIPETVRKEKENHTPYKARAWRGVARSPVRTRSSCKPTSSNEHRDLDDDDDDADDDDDDDDNDDNDNDARPPTPTPNRSKGGRLTQQSSKGHGKGKVAKVTIQERQYCTHACLRGLAWGGAIDAACPNAAQHGGKHLEPARFLGLLCDQIARDRGHDADVTPLNLSGSVGSLFKIRLSAFGYTLVAKGMVTENLTFLQGEKDMYDALSTIQGQYIPVCLGLINPILPLYYDGNVCRHLLLLSWAGRSLSRCFGQADPTAAVPAVMAAYTHIHQLRVLHGDAHPRNILFDAASGRFMVADFERSTIIPRPALGLISPNSRRKRKRMHGLKQEKDEFTKEVESVISHVNALFMR